MLRFAFVGFGILLGFAIVTIHPFSPSPVFAQQAASPSQAQAPSREVEAKLDQAMRQIQDLKVLAASQGSRITSLERSVRALQDQLTTPTGNRWKTADGWAQLRLGMSRAEIENVLGPPKSVDSVIDKQTMTYGTDSAVVGTVTLVDDRASHIEAPGFKIVMPEPGR